jgi:hypothetical protein
MTTEVVDGVVQLTRSFFPGVRHGLRSEPVEVGSEFHQLTELYHSRTKVPMRSQYLWSRSLKNMSPARCIHLVLSEQVLDRQEIRIPSPVLEGSEHEVLLVGNVD